MFREFPANKILVELKRNDLLPAILFRTSRRQCDNDVDRLSKYDSAEQSVDAQREIRSEIHAVIDKYGLDREVITEHPHYNALIQTGSGAHHAGQLLLWRLLLEELMSRGVLRLMVATGTVAAGVDFPARTVVVTAHSKRGAEGFRTLTASEFQQMSGRSGRRGKDAVGICLVAPGAFSDARVIAEIAKKSAEPLRSAYFASPSTVLNLLRYRSVDDLRYTVEKSLAAFLDRKASGLILANAHEKQERLDSETDLADSVRKKLEKQIRRTHREAETVRMKQLTLLEKSLEGLERLGHLEQGKLTEKGYWAANLWTTLILELAEAVDDGFMTDLSVHELVGSVALIAGDSYKPYLTIRDLPIKKELQKKMEDFVLRVDKMYERPPGASEIGVRPEGAITVLTWMEAEDWGQFASLLKLGGVAEGDAARLITQTADHLHQLSRLYDSHPELATAAEEGAKRLLRPPLTEVLARAAD